MSGLKLRLNEVEDKVDKFNQVIARYLKAQWLSWPTKRKLFNFLFLVYSQLCGGRPTK
ncbi:hypothetical protein P7G58_04340 [Globicatella sulfidifaciens]|uniref:hypothetical protein n=1 Tax=Globicatella sulfidifaciens TaxID=136093 RepID=UPI00288FB4B9|nr:hypothetical protein [Globicatella sulfidifaciens]MDT2768090.1 hypothetical protein [Globicatella sulfidifaciens]